MVWQEDKDAPANSVHMRARAHAHAHADAHADGNVGEWMQRARWPLGSPRLLATPAPQPHDNSIWPIKAVKVFSLEYFYYI